MNLNIDKHIPHEKLSFVKMNGNGNDFVIFDSRLKNINFTKHDIKKISDRHFGVGCDQVILLENSSHADIFMRIYNSNGSEAQMCGNAAKCVAAMLFSSINQHTLKIETISGIIYAESKANGVVAVNMGVPKRNWEQIPISKNIDTSEINLSEINKLLIKGIALSMGNPHIVFIVPSHDLINLEGMDNKMLALLAKENILTLNDFADLATFELIDKNEGIFRKLDLEEEMVNKMIMKARENWFTEDK